jgi:hypothetical protein
MSNLLEKNNYFIPALIRPPVTFSQLMLGEGWDEGEAEHLQEIEL